MPGGNRTGPLGQGPMTGGGFGFCGGTPTGFSRNRLARFNRGRGFGRGRGLNFRGWRYLDMEYPNAQRHDLNPPDFYPHDELEMLEQEANHLEQSLEKIKKRIIELQKKEKSTSP